MFEVHVFLGTGQSLCPEATGYPVGERHAFLAFLRQARSSDHDWIAAEAHLNSEHWGNVEFSKAGTASRPELDDEVADALDAAIRHGWAFIIYSDPVEREQ